MSSSSVNCLSVILSPACRREWLESQERLLSYLGGGGLRRPETDGYVVGREEQHAPSVAAPAS